MPSPSHRGCISQPLDAAASILASHQIPQFGLVPPELLRIMPSGRIEAPDLVGKIEQATGQAASDAALQP
jgi:hypothetical protein